MSRQRQRRRRRFRNRAAALQSNNVARPGILGKRWRVVLAIATVVLALSFALGSAGVALLGGSSGYAG